ncbi:hypothetical protein D1872_264420 [compost metagenome]
MRNSPAPSILADSIISSGTVVWKNVRMTMMENALSDSGRIKDQIVFCKCRNWVITMYPGTMPPENSIVKNARKLKNPRNPKLFLDTA